MNRFALGVMLAAGLLVYSKSALAQIPAHSDSDEKIETQHVPLWTPELNWTLRWIPSCCGV